MSNETVTYSLDVVLKEIKDSIKEVSQKFDKIDERFDRLDNRLTKLEALPGLVGKMYSKIHYSRAREWSEPQRHKGHKDRSILCKLNLSHRT
ncbi:hypothetical protein PN482_19805 [Microcystis aeruginosa CS-555/01A07]|uniref:hypothetical protein n=1 Tax=Microcystis aeruginosa TaxID=1126 RepID=UPI00232C62F6|nr:hypothetical protein [Microcystis aeruginosa]MDB9431074.1 hypothetical protein [Microcystis aeruginosa CS-555/01A07]